MTAQPSASATSPKLPDQAQDDLEDAGSDDGSRSLAGQPDGTHSSQRKVEDMTKKTPTLPGTPIRAGFSTAVLIAGCLFVVVERSSNWALLRLSPNSASATATSANWALLILCLGVSLLCAVVAVFTWVPGRRPLGDLPINVDGTSPLATTTAGGSALIVLLAGSDLLEIVIGKDASEHIVGPVLCLGGVIAGVTVGLAPLILRICNWSESTASGRSSIFANIMILFANVFQVNLVTALIFRVDDGPLAVATGVTAVVILLAVGISTAAAFNEMRPASTPSDSSAQQTIRPRSRMDLAALKVTSGARSALL